MKDVINNVQKDFEDNGIDLAVLQDLEKMWETRIVNSNVANFDLMAPPSFPQAPQTMPLDSEKLSGSGSHSISIPGVEDYASYYEHTYGHPDISAMSYNNLMMGAAGNQYAAASLASLASHRGLGGMPSNPHPSVNSLVSASNSSQSLGSNNHYPPHYQHSHQAQLPSYGGHLHSEYPPYSLSSLAHQDLYTNSVNPNPDYNLGPGADPYRSTGPPQLDGPSDAIEITHKMADRWLKSHKLGRRLKPIPQVDGEDDLDNDLDVKLEENDEDAINSDLDDSDEGEADDAEKDGVEHIILCQYDKVSRTKNRWRCSLKDGIILVNGKDYLFNKATGEFQW
ncbi:transcription factor IIA subunit alpha [Massospora cicadina]|nr:transcription factor IIA subunit alpha [Massospora cicadina]